MKKKLQFDDCFGREFDTGDVNCWRFIVWIILWITKKNWVNKNLFDNTTRKKKQMWLNCKQLIQFWFLVLLWQCAWVWLFSILCNDHENHFGWFSLNNWKMTISNHFLFSHNSTSSIFSILVSMYNLFIH